MLKTSSVSILENSLIKLRALEKSDIDILYRIENDTSNWLISSTLIPFSKNTLENYLQNAHEDIFTAKQLRLVIIDKLRENKIIGLIDLFDYDPLQCRAGIGIVILEHERNKGFGFLTIEQIKIYAKQVLHLHQLYANILSDNISSVKLFEKCDFKFAGNKKEWVRTPYGSWMDEFMYQCIL